MREFSEAVGVRVKGCLKHFVEAGAWSVQVVIGVSLLLCCLLVDGWLLTIYNWLLIDWWVVVGGRFMIGCGWSLLMVDGLFVVGRCWWLMIVVCWLLVVGLIRVFAFCQVLLGWKTYKYYYETDELPNPRSTQPKKNWVKSGTWATFSLSKLFFVGWDLFYIGNRLQETQPIQILRKHPRLIP